MAVSLSARNARCGPPSRRQISAPKAQPVGSRGVARAVSRDAERSQQDRERPAPFEGVNVEDDEPLLLIRRTPGPELYADDDVQRFWQRVVDFW